MKGGCDLGTMSLSTFSILPGLFYLPFGFVLFMSFEFFLFICVYACNILLTIAVHAAGISSPRR